MHTYIHTICHWKNKKNNHTYKDPSKTPVKSSQINFHNCMKNMFKPNQTSCKNHSTNAPTIH